MMKTILSALISLTVLFPLLAFAKAERYGLLVGVGSYPKAALEGPVHDVAAVKKVLTQSWGFSDKNINILLDKEGTKANILKALETIYKNSKPGDELFLYFSGHGTSASDRDLRFPLPTTSGAFIPYDIRDAKNIKQAVEKLVVGKQDLKPVLSKLDQGGRHVFIAIDACYSGNAVRGRLQDQNSQLPSRFLDIESILPGRGFGDDLENTGTEVWEKQSSKQEPYPYKNIFYLSASGEHEQAKDIPRSRLNDIPTVDNKPHGAFTDTLLRVLNNKATADVDNDGIITYRELTRTVRRLMRLRGFSHTPNGLPSVAEDKGQLASRGIFLNLENDTSTREQQLALQAKDVAKKIAKTEDARKKQNKQQNNFAIPTLDPSVYKVQVKDGDAGFRKKLAALKNIKVVSNRPDITVQFQGSSVDLISGAGDLILSLNNPSSQQLVNMVEHQAWAHKLVNGQMNQDFNVDLDFFGEGRGSVAVKGEDIGFTVSSEKPAYLLLVGIDAYGKISVLYPYFKKELNSVDARQVVNMEKIAKVGPPYGRDYIQLYAFDKLTPDLEKLVGATIEPDSSLKKTFERLINDDSLKKARASIELVTADRR